MRCVGACISNQPRAALWRALRGGARLLTFYLGHEVQVRLWALAVRVFKSAGSYEETCRGVLCVVCCGCLLCTTRLTLNVNLNLGQVWLCPAAVAGTPPPGTTRPRATVLHVSAGPTDHDRGGVAAVRHDPAP